MTPTCPRAAQIPAQNRRYIPGGVVSSNRAGAPYFLGQNDFYVSAAARRVLDEGASLFGAGTTELEGHLAGLICTHIAHHVFAAGERLRRQLIESGLYFFPLAAKQCSISAAHTEADVSMTADAVRRAPR